MKRLFITLVLLSFLTGCAGGPQVSRDIGRPSVPGIYHEVTKGQTLWHIAKIYRVDLRNLINANRLPNASKIEVGQLVFIPEVRETDRSSYIAEVVKFESFIWPVKGRVVSYFGSTKDMAKNKGIDIKVQKGATIVAARSGKVTFVSDHLKGYGKTIIIDHGDGFETVYAHNTANLVETNQAVRQGEIIARAGETGRVKLPTLHFEIRKKNDPQNPFYYLP